MRFQDLSFAKRLLIALGLCALGFGLLTAASFAISFLSPPPARPTPARHVADDYDLIVQVDRACAEAATNEFPGITRVQNRGGNIVGPVAGWYINAEVDHLNARGGIERELFRVKLSATTNDNGEAHLYGSRDVAYEYQQKMKALGFDSQGHSTW